jgi:predicted nucleotidyltransferase
LDFHQKWIEPRVLLANFKMGNIFNQDFQEFLLALNEKKVQYVLVGGYSVIYHGFPRTTGDLDLFVEVSKKNYYKLVQAFELFQMPTFDMTGDSFLNQSTINVYTFGRPPVCIEILKEISGFTFQEINGNAIQAVFEGIPMKIIHLNDLRRNKEISGRSKDLNDLENLSEL